MVKDVQQMNLFEEKLLSVQNRSRYRIIGQVFDTYWLIQFEDKLFIIDQHAAHEKVKYERLMKQFHEKSVVSQRLMPPIIVSLTGQEESILHTMRMLLHSSDSRSKPSAATNMPCEVSR